MFGWSEKKKNILAALFARSNIGFPDIEMRKVQELKRYTDVSLNSAVMSICGEFIDSESSLYSFMEEAEGWRKDMETKGFEAYLNHRLVLLYDMIPN